MRIPFFAFLCLFLSGTVWGEEPNFVCEPAPEWTALFDRNDGWIAGDGIYSFGMEGDSRQGSATETSKTIFTFGDSLIGGANPDGSYKPGLAMVNHCYAVLEGTHSNAAKMTFLYNTNPEGRPSNWFEQKFWLADSIVIDSVVYTVGVVVDPRTWAMEGPWLIEVPIRDGKLDFSGHRTKRAELFHKDGAFEVLFGIGILDEGENIYVYGVRDKKGEAFYRRQLVVAKAPRKSYGDVATWRFWTGKSWSESITECNHDEAALTDAISKEFSVTKMIGGKYDDKYVLVYTEMCLSEKLDFAVADSPHSKFTGTTTFYRCPEPKDFDAEIKRKCGEKANVVTYNAKAHPRLSGPGELLVSYNLNVFGLREGMIFAEKKYGFPRFVRLKLP